MSKEEINNYLINVKVSVQNATYLLLQISTMLEQTFFDDYRKLLNYISQLIKNAKMGKIIEYVISNISSAVLNNEIAMAIINSYAEENDIALDFKDDNNFLSVNQADVLSQAEFLKLYNEYKQGSKKAKEEIFNRYLSLVSKISKYYLNRGIEFDDLFQEGCIGLISAIENYKEGQNFKLWATTLINSAILQAITMKANIITIPAYFYNKASEISARYEELLYELNDEEKAKTKVLAEFGISKHFFLNSLKAKNALSVASLDQMVSEDSSTMDTYIADFDLEETIINKIELTRIRKYLEDPEFSESDRKVITLEYGLDGNVPLRPIEISQKLGISRQSVNYFKHKSLTRLHTMASSDETKKTSLYSYFKGVSKTKLKIAVGLLEDKDIKIIVKLFGSNLDETPNEEVDYDYVSKILNEKIPNILTEYKLFCDSMQSFMHEGKDMLLLRLRLLEKEKRELIFSLFDRKTLYYRKYAHVPFADVKAIYSMLKEIKNKELARKTPSQEKVRAKKYLINREEFIEKVMTADLTKMERYVVSAYYGIPDNHRSNIQNVSQGAKKPGKYISSVIQAIIRKIFGDDILYSEIYLIDEKLPFKSENISGYNLFEGVNISKKYDSITIKHMNKKQFLALLDLNILNPIQTFLLKLKYSLIEGVEYSYFDLAKKYDLPKKYILELLELLFPDKKLKSLVLDDQINITSDAPQIEKKEENANEQTPPKEASPKEEIPPKTIDANKNKSQDINSIRNILYYFPNENIGDLFMVIGSLNKDDIQIIIKRFGPKLLSDNLVNPYDYERINYLISTILPIKLAQYKRFKVSLPCFFEIDDINHIKSSLKSLDKDTLKLLYEVFDRATLKYTNGANVPAEARIELFKILEKMTISKTASKDNEKKEEIDLQESTLYEHLISAMLAANKREIYLGGAKSSKQYSTIVKTDIPKKKQEFFLLTTGLVEYFGKYTLDEILKVIMDGCLEEVSILLKYYDLATLKFAYQEKLTFKDVYELYGFIKYKLEEELRAKYPGRIKMFDEESNHEKYCIKCTALSSFISMANKVSRPLAIKIADFLYSSNFDEKILETSAIFSFEEQAKIRNAKSAIMAFIDEYLGAINSLKSLNKLHSKVNYQLEKSAF